MKSAISILANGVVIIQVFVSIGIILETEKWQTILSHIVMTQRSMWNSTTREPIQII